MFNGCILNEIKRIKIIFLYHSYYITRLQDMRYLFL